LQELMEDETATSGRAKRLRTRLERAMEFDREIAATGRDKESALENRIRSLEALVRERDDALRASARERLELLEKTKSLRAEARERSDESDAAIRRATLAEETIDALTKKNAALERVRDENIELQCELKDRARTIEELEQRVEALRRTARMAERRQVSAEITAAKSEALVNEYLATPAGEDRLRLEHRIGALQEKIRDLTAKESRLAERRRAALAEELATARHALAMEKLRNITTKIDDDTLKI
jgi:predicted  nucleic acid-binding Zn-ribbon protein